MMKQFSPVIVLLVTALVSFSGQAQADLQRAYQREFAFLEAERSSLASRLAQLEADSNVKIGAARAEVDRLQGAVLGMSLQTERMAELLNDVERQADTAAEGDDVLETLLSQMAATLEKADVKLEERKEGDKAAQLSQLQFAFDRALPLLQTYSSVRTEKGEFFVKNGDKVEGTVVRIGQVSSFGVSEAGSGALAPAGAGHLKIWPDGDSSAVAQALSRGTAVDRLNVFLYESLDKGVEKRKDRTPVEVIDSGGVIGWVIVGAGVLAMLMALLRAFSLWRAAANTTSLVEAITPMVEQKQFAKAIDVCKSARSAGGRVLTATLQNLDRDRQELEDIITEAILHEQPALDRFGSAIVVVAAVAPLLGLLGTVTGMIATFDIITEFGTGNPKLLSGGIAIALVTTELGLIVAIPALIVGNMLSAWAGGIKDGIDKAALRITNIATGVRLSERPSVPPKKSEPLDTSDAVPAT